MNLPICSVIVDDETLSRQKIRRMMQKHPEIEIVGECAGGQEAIEIVNGQQPDLLFLDIQMPDTDGFSVLQSLTALPVVIFITAYEEYALRAFEFHALDYLLKPFDVPRFEQALSYAQQTLEYRDREGVQNKIRKLLDQIRDSNRYLQRIAVKNNERITFLQVRDIEWIESHSKAICFHAGRTTHFMRGNLIELESSLNPVQFVRIHRGAIVNLDRVMQVDLLSHEDCRVTMESGARLLLSRRYKKNLREKLRL